MKKGANPDIRTFFTPATKRIALCESQRVIPTEESNTAMMDGAMIQNSSSAIAEHAAVLDSAHTTAVIPSEAGADSLSESVSGECCFTLDIASFVNCSGQKVSDHILLNVIKTRTPAASIPMPSRLYSEKSRKDGKRRRYCNRQWFERFPFISYSQSQQGLYCLPCVLFPVPQSTSGRAQSLISRPLTDWKDAVSILNVHSGLEYHLHSEAKMNAFCHTMSNSDKRLDMIVNVATQEQVAKNRAILTSIIKCVEFCGRHGIALRGHRDDSTSTDLS